MEHARHATTSRGEGRSRPHGNSAAAAERSVRVVNLGKLVNVLGTDGVSAALTIREELLKSILSGREPLRGEHQQHLSIRLADAGFPPNWLEYPKSEVTPHLAEVLKKLAADSIQKAPIRRLNLKRLVDAFPERLHILADALELQPASITNILENTAQFDDHRMGHINPRLFRAGFPDGWLEQGNPEMKPEWLVQLEAIATDSYEEALSTSEIVKPEPVAVVEKETVTPIKRSAKVGATSVNINKPSQAKEETVASNTTKASKGAAASPTTVKLPAGISRSVLSAGRPMPGRAPVPTPTADKPAATTRPAATPVAAKPKTTTVTKKTAPKTIVRPAAAPAPAPAPRPKAKATAPASKPASTAPELFTEDENKITKEQSIVRAKNLERLMATARRGAKACLWRDLLDKSLAYSGNVKNGAIRIRNTFANEITDLLGLPRDWLDEPTFPPATLSEWVTNPNIPLPKSRDQALSAQTVKPVVRPQAAAPVKAQVPAPVKAPAKAPVQVQAPLPTIPAASAAKTRGIASAGRSMTPLKKPATVAAPPVLETPKPPVAVPAPVTPVAAKPSPAALEIPEATVAGFVWSPAAVPEALIEPGPLVQVLVDQMQKMAKAGTFTEKDALNLLYYLMNR